jgi:poly-gamma-glutamate synthesis protein (capsule biosynthesis protein)
MARRLILTGDVNLMNVTDAAVPFRRVAAELHAADAVFGNLECCLHIPERRSHSAEGFFAEPIIGGEALRSSGIHAVGIANNVNYGAANIAASIARPATGFASASCSGARFIGRPTTRPVTTSQASQ